MSDRDTEVETEDTVTNDCNTCVTDEGNLATVEDQLFDEIPHRDSSMVPSQNEPTELLIVPFPSLDVSNDIVAMESEDLEEDISANSENQAFNISSLPRDSKLLDIKLNLTPLECAFKVGKSEERSNVNALVQSLEDGAQQKQTVSSLFKEATLIAQESVLHYISPFFQAFNYADKWFDTGQRIKFCSSHPSLTHFRLSKSFESPITMLETGNSSSFVPFNPQLVSIGCIGTTGIPLKAHTEEEEISKNDAASMFENFPPQVLVFELETIDYYMEKEFSTSSQKHKAEFAIEELYLVPFVPTVIYQLPIMYPCRDLSLNFPGGTYRVFINNFASGYHFEIEFGVPLFIEYVTICLMVEFLEIFLGDHHILYHFPFDPGATQFSVRSGGTWMAHCVWELLFELEDVRLLKDQVFHETHYRATSSVLCHIVATELFSVSFAHLVALADITVKTFSVAAPTLKMALSAMISHVGFFLHNSVAELILVEEDMLGDEKSGNIISGFLLGGICEERLLTDAFDILRVMLEKAKTLDFIIRYTLVTGLLKSGIARDATSLSMSHVDSYVQPDVLKQSVLIYGLRQEGYLNKAAIILTQMAAIEVLDISDALPFWIKCQRVPYVSEPDKMDIDGAPTVRAKSWHTSGLKYAIPLNYRAFASWFTLLKKLHDPLLWTKCIYKGVSGGFWRGDFRKFGEDCLEFKPTKFCRVLRVYEWVYTCVMDKDAVRGSLEQLLIQYAHNFKSMEKGLRQMEVSPHLFQGNVFRKTILILGTLSAMITCSSTITREFKVILMSQLYQGKIRVLESRRAMNQHCLSELSKLGTESSTPFSQLAVELCYAYNFLLAEFSDLNLEDKVLIDGGSNVMNYLRGLVYGLGNNLRWSPSTKQSNKRLIWDPGPINKWLKGTRHYHPQLSKL